MPSLKSSRSIKLPTTSSKIIDVANFSNEFIAIFVGRIIIFLIILSYVMNVETKCNRCVNDTNLKSIKYMSIGFIIYNILLLIFPNLFDVRVELLSYLVYIIYIVSIIKYVKKMNTHESCSSCSKDWRKTFMNIFAYITIIGIAITGLLTLSSIFMLSRFMR
jgi:hypothetical protein